MNGMGITDAEAGEPEGYLESSGRGKISFNTQKAILERQAALAAIEAKRLKERERVREAYKREKAMAEAEAEKAREAKRKEEEERRVKEKCSKAIKKAASTRAMHKAEDAVRERREREAAEGLTKMPTNPRTQVPQPRTAGEYRRWRIENVIIPLDGRRMAEANRPAQTPAPATADEEAALAEALARSVDPSQQVVPPRLSRGGVIFREGGEQAQRPRAQSEEAQGKGKGKMMDEAEEPTPRRKKTPPPTSAEGGSSTAQVVEEILLSSQSTATEENPADPSGEQAEEPTTTNASSTETSPNQ